MPSYLPSTEKKQHQPILYPVKISFKNMDTIHISSVEQKLREFTTDTSMTENLKHILQEEGQFFQVEGWMQGIVVRNESGECVGKSSQTSTACHV